MPKTLRWTSGHDEWYREDGVRLTRSNGSDDPTYVWKAVRPASDSTGQSEVEVEEPNAFRAMDAIDLLWPVL